MADATLNEFQITIHAAERILEVVYPSHPDERCLQRYEDNVRRAILGLGGTWDCLIDQRALNVAAPQVTDRISSLIVWARSHGMRKAARIVKSSGISELQARRLLQLTGLGAGASLHHEREDAWRALTAVELQAG